MHWEWEMIYYHDAGIFVPTGRGMDTETRWVGDLFLPDDFWFRSDTNKKCAVMYNLYLDI